jgi:dipeptidyl aminopeptidase/acylaminoacyl peptidase
MLKFLASAFGVAWIISVPTNLLAAEVVITPQEKVASILSEVKCQDFRLPDLNSGYEKHESEAYQIKDIEYVACDGKKIQAYVVRPLTNSKQAAILYVHWLDANTKDSNRTQFLEEAKIMAAKGVSSLLISTFWSIPGGYYFERRWQDDYQNTLHQLKDLQHAVEILKSIPNLDTNNLHFVGHDYGATFGAMLLGIDQSFNSAVLMAGIADISDWYVYGSGSGVPQANELDNFKQQFHSVNPHQLIQYSNAKILFQYAKKDFFISSKQAEALYTKAAKGAEVKFYDSDHSLKVNETKLDRIDWLNRAVAE